MSTTASTDRPSAWHRAGMILMFLSVAVIAYFSWPSTWTDYFLPPGNEGLDEIIADANRDVATDAVAVANNLETIDTQQGCRNSDGTTDWQCWRTQHNPQAEHVAEGRQARAEQVALGEGKLLKPNSVWLAAYQSSWLYTDVPIYGCVDIKVEGRTKYGTYYAGPDGVDLASMNSFNQQSWRNLNHDRQTLVSGVRWGTVLGRTCETENGKKVCSQPFPLGRGGYLSSKQFGAGYLDVIVNGFVHRQTGIGFLSGQEDLGMGDYNAYEEGFVINRQKAEDYMCDPAKRVAQIQGG